MGKILVCMWNDVFLSPVDWTQFNNNWITTLSCDVTLFGQEKRLCQRIDRLIKLKLKPDTHKFKEKQIKQMQYTDHSRLFLRLLFAYLALVLSGWMLSKQKGIGHTRIHQEPLITRYISHIVTWWTYKSQGTLRRLTCFLLRAHVRMMAASHILHPLERWLCMSSEMNATHPQDSMRPWTVGGSVGAVWGCDRVRGQ